MDKRKCDECKKKEATRKGKDNWVDIFICEACYKKELKKTEPRKYPVRIK